MLNVLTLFRVIGRRIASSKGLTLSTILGIISAFALVIAIPLFSRSVNAQLLKDELETLSQKTGRPPFSLRFYLLDYQSDAISVEDAYQLSNYLAERTSDFIGLPTKDIVTSIRSVDMNAYAKQLGVYSEENRVLNSLRFDSVSDIEGHMRILEGTWPDALASPEGRLLGMVHQSLAVRMGLHVGEKYVFQEGWGGVGIPVQIVGTWITKDKGDPFWFEWSPSLEYGGSVLLSTEAYTRALAPLLRDQIGYVSYYVVMDASEARWQRADQYVQGIRRLLSTLQRSIPSIKMDYSPLEPLEDYSSRSRGLQITLLAIISPLVALVLAYLVLMAEISVRRQRQEIATLRSRGMGQPQIIGLSLVETALLGALALPASAGVAWVAAIAMSHIRSFLRFSHQGSFPMAFDISDLRAVAVAWTVIALARLVPALNAAQHTIVSMKWEQARPLAKPWWQRTYLDILSIIPAAYGYYVLSHQTGPLVPTGLASQDPFRAPLLFLAPSFFALSVCLIAVRLFPFLLAVFSARSISQLYPSTVYLSLNHLARRPSANSGPLLLVMLAMALSSYFASVAVTLDTWLVHKTRYQVGADLVISEHPPAELLSGESVRPEDVEELELAIRLMPVNDHLRFPGVLHAARVGRYPGILHVGSAQHRCEVTAIDRLDFPKVAFFRDDFVDTSFGALMNALAETEAAVLVPRQFFEQYALSLGDFLAVALRQQPSTHIVLRVVGVYDYFPTVFPTDSPTLIANLDYISMQLETLPPFDIWLDLVDKPDTAGLIKEIEDTLQVNVSTHGDALAMIEQEEDRSERVGVFGALTIGFLAAGLTSGLGFVLYSYASLRERFIQLGILRAIGLSVSQMIVHVGFEQLLLMGFALISGTGIGLLTSHLYTPFLQVGFQEGKIVPPFQVLVGWWQTIQISAGFGLVLLIVLTGTVWYLVHLRMFEAIKLGEVG